MNEDKKVVSQLVLQPNKLPMTVSCLFVHKTKVLSRGTAMKLRHLCPFCAIPAIYIAVHISATNNF